MAKIVEFLFTDRFVNDKVNDFPRDVYASSGVNCYGTYQHFG